MIISIRLKNFFSLHDDVALDFTAISKPRKMGNHLPENLLIFNGDKFLNILGLFGSNASGKSNVIKAIDFCRKLVLTSHLNNDGDQFDFEPFKFEPGKPSEFYINFVTEGSEYEYSFSLQDNRVVNESLYHFPNKRRSRIFERKNTFQYSHRKGYINRPTEIEANTGANALFLSRASSMSRPIAQKVYRFFKNEMAIGLENIQLADFSEAEFELHKPMLLKALEVGDSDIVDLRLSKSASGETRLLSFHKENASVAFDFNKEESEGTKRLLSIVAVFIKASFSETTLFIDEFDLKLHLFLAEFVLDMVRATHSSQLVFTSHNSNLINNEKLRLEQIIMVNKDHTGSSMLTPLSDYEGITPSTNIQKAYLQGRFDAVPYIGNANSLTAELHAKA